MRTKPKSPYLGEYLPEVHRVFRHRLHSPEGLPADFLRSFSAMKYGHPASIQALAAEMVEALMADPHCSKEFSKGKSLQLASSAFGSVPSAAHALSLAMLPLLEGHGLHVSLFKLQREGGFDRTNYGALEQEAREKAIRSRKICLEPGLGDRLDGQNVLIVDDLRSTGTHEMAIRQLFAQHSPNAKLHFAYLIGFEEGIRAAHEEQLNHAYVQHQNDLIPFFLSENGPILNARLLKFILLLKGAKLIQFLEAIGCEKALPLYWACLSSDKYYLRAKFKDSFQALEEWLLAKNCIEKRHSPGQRNQAEGKVVAWNIKENAAGEYICTETGQDLSAQIRMYSRFKFGDVEAIGQLSLALAEAFVQELKAGGKLREVFERAKEKGEYVSLTAPGIRNVVSASNFLMREVGMQVNAWLSRQGLPTMIIRSLPRLGSGRANYAELSAKERALREKTTQTIIPKSEYREFPTHVIFLDDVEVSGQTANRARSNSLSARALSFHSVFAFRVDPSQAKQDAGIEHRLNQFEVSGNLDEGLAKILAHPEYQPVQRMLRLLLHPRNRAALPDFLQNHMPDHSLKRIYFGAMANDYLWIHSEEPGKLGEYGPSLLMLEKEMQERGLMVGG